MKSLKIKIRSLASKNKIREKNYLDVKKNFLLDITEYVGH